MSWRVFRSGVKEKVVWVDTKKTQVRTRAGRLNEEERTVVEVQQRAPGRLSTIKAKRLWSL